MSGSDKLPSLERFQTDLRYFGQPPFAFGPSATASVPTAPHPFIAHFYPLSAGSECTNLGYNRSANPISRQSSAAALVALAASGCVGKNFSSQFLQNFQNRSLKNNCGSKNNTCSTTAPSTDDPPSKRLRHQSNNDSVNISSPPLQQNNPFLSQQNALIQYPGLSGLGGAHVQTAWQLLFNRFRASERHSNTIDNNPTSEFGKNLSFGSFRENSASQATNPRSRSYHQSVRPSSSSTMPTRRQGCSPSEQPRHSFKRAISNPSQRLKKSPRHCPSVDDLSEAENHSTYVDIETTKLSDENNAVLPTPLKQQDYNSNGALMHDKREEEFLSASNDRCSSTSSDQSQDDNSQRRRRKQASSVGDTCPVCGVTVRSSEIESHMKQEVEKLRSISSEIKKNENKRRLSTEKRSFNGAIVTSSMSATGKKYSEISAKSNQSNRLKTYLKVRNNRHERLNMKVGQGLRAHRTMTDSSNLSMAPFNSNPIWSSSSPWSPHLSSLPSSCPVCCTKFQGTLSDMHEHIGRCLRQRNVNQQIADEDVEVDVVELPPPPLSNGCSSTGSHEEDRSEKSFGSEYEWCGQTRIRATSLLDRNSLAASGFFVVKPSSPEEDSEKFLNVETDDTQVYGPTQFMEEKLVQLESSPDDEKKERPYEKTRFRSPSSSLSPSPGHGSSMTDVVASLREKIEHLESQARSTRCMICMDVYKDPVTSIQCWHVHCEVCWLRALAVKKLCPQCNAITPPDKLRRIFL